MEKTDNSSGFTGVEQSHDQASREKIIKDYVSSFRARQLVESPQQNDDVGLLYPWKDMQAYEFGASLRQDLIQKVAFNSLERPLIENIISQVIQKTVEDIILDDEIEKQVILLSQYSDKVGQVRLELQQEAVLDVIKKSIVEEMIESTVVQALEENITASKALVTENKEVSVRRDVIAQELKGAAPDAAGGAKLKTTSRLQGFFKSLVKSSKQKGAGEPLDAWEHVEAEKLLPADDSASPASKLQAGLFVAGQKSSESAALDGQELSPSSDSADENDDCDPR
jgi:hypothetical protein